MISVAEAEARILAGREEVGTQTIALGDAAGRVLAEDVMSLRTHPPHDVSAMDGYAARHADLAILPATLTVTQRIPAGAMPHGELKPGEAARIFTGAVLPPGADTIVIQENTRAEGDVVQVLEGVAPGRHIRRAGYDFMEGAVLAAAGRRLTPQDIGLIAAGNVTTLRVHRRPRVAFLATGDELVLPGETPGPSQIIASTGVALAAMISNWGGEPVDLGIARDTEEDIRAKAAPGLGADVFVTLGGASVGDLDLVQPVLTGMGLKVDFWKIAMRPGKPLMFGDLGRAAMIGLPGNPVSALVCARLFLEPLVRVLGGESWNGHRLVSAVAGADLPANDSRQDYLRAVVTREGDRLVATPLPVQDSGMLSALARADGLIVRAPSEDAATKGAAVRLIALASWI
jgi:molybdopterin molybdotransferase